MLIFHGIQLHVPWWPRREQSISNMCSRLKEVGRFIWGPTDFSRIPSCLLLVRWFKHLLLALLAPQQDLPCNMGTQENTRQQTHILYNRDGSRLFMFRNNNLKNILNRTYQMFTSCLHQNVYGTYQKLGPKMALIKCLHLKSRSLWVTDRKRRRRWKRPSRGLGGSIPHPGEAEWFRKKAGSQHV